MTLNELEKYCIEQGIKNSAKSAKSKDSRSERFYAGRANAFMWIAACIQNDSFKGNKNKR